MKILGGAAYFCDRPLERMLRDARINQIGEGANEVLTSFIALVGMREPGENLRAVWQALHQPWSGCGTLSRFAVSEIHRRVTAPFVPVRSPELVSHARVLGRWIGRFGIVVERTLMRHREAILERQLVQERIANAAMELFASACVLSRRDAELQREVATSMQSAWDAAAATLFLEQSAQRIREALNSLSDDDSAIVEAAKSVLA